MFNKQLFSYYYFFTSRIIQGWGNHPGKAGHSLTNILTLDTENIAIMLLSSCKNIKEKYRVRENLA